MRKKITFPKIYDYRYVILNLIDKFKFVGLDNDGNPIFDNSIVLPTLTFKGTVKLHGTNGGVSYNSIDGMWAQSKDNVLSILEDNNGFALFVEQRKNVFMNFFNKLIDEHKIDTSVNTITIYGEFAGKTIQKNVAICSLPKQYYIFGVKISKPFDIEFKSYWIDYSKIFDNDNQIYNIDQFEKYYVDVDLNNPKDVEDQLSELTHNVESECPVGKSFGIIGTGEGIVWSYMDNSDLYRFKTKGEKHKVTKSKINKIVSIDQEEIDSINEFVDYAFTENRFNQGLDIVNKGVLHKSILSNLIKWILNDIFTEEGNIIIDKKLDIKKVNKELSKAIVKMFMEKYNNI